MLQERPVRKILVLGGTTEGRELVSRLADDPRFDACVSLAGRTQAIREQGAPMRVGGFGGVPGLADHLRQHAIDVLIDATHPFASVISENARQAAAEVGIAFLAVCRPAWTPRPGDVWCEVADLAEAMRQIGPSPRRVFLALGRKEVHVFAHAPQHFYLVRSVDPVVPALDVPRAHYLVARGPFEAADERKLLEAHAIDCLVSRNSGGEAAYGKIEAARALGVPVLMVRRPTSSAGPTVQSPAEALRWLEHHASAPRAGAGPSAAAES